MRRTTFANFGLIAVSKPSLPDLIRQIEQSELVSAIPEKQGRRIRIRFSKQPPKKPGVYIVYDCGDRDDPRPFYVGEAGDLLTRLTGLFRCNRPADPHPCQRKHAKANKIPTRKVKCNAFCERYKVRCLSTENLLGRIEVEKALQSKFGTNRGG
jgi:hypothetical protein